MIPLKFNISIIDKETIGDFDWAEERNPIFEEFDDALEFLGIDQNTKIKKVLNNIIKIDKEFIDAYNHLGLIEFHNKKYNKSFDFYNQGFKVGEKIIPRKFSGKIYWGTIDNRPFLRSLHGLGLCYLKLGNIKKAINSFERILNYNPNDNQGIRYLMGGLYLKIGDLKKAEKNLKENLDDPMAKYNFGLLLLKKKKHIEAIKLFRHAFVENIYIVELLTGKPFLYAYKIFHGTNIAEPEYAIEYYEEYSELWKKDSDSFIFLYTVFNNSMIKKEIENVYQKNFLLNIVKPDEDKGIEKRRKIITEKEDLVKKIDDISSAKILKSIEPFIVKNT